MSNNYCRKSGLRQPVPEAYSPKKLAPRKTAAAEDAYRAVNLTTNKRVQFQVCLSNAGIEATTGSIADPDHVVNQLEREINDITSKDHMRFTKESSIRLVEFPAWCQVIGVQQLRRTIQHRVIYFGYPMMHLVSHM